MKQYLIATLLGGSLLTLSTSLQADQSMSSEAAGSLQSSEKKAERFIEDLGQEAIKTLTVKKLTKGERKQKFKKLFHKAFSFQSIAKFVLGKHWRTLKPDQKKEYIQLFEENITETYEGAFAQYDENNQFKVTSAVKGSKPGSFMVKSQLVRKDGPPVDIGWRVFEKEGAFKITDVIVEGVSMSVTQRSEYASIISRRGGKVEGLLVALREALEDSDKKIDKTFEKVKSKAAHKKA